mgnify:FL=1
MPRAIIKGDVGSLYGRLLRGGAVVALFGRLVGDGDIDRPP